MSALHRTGSRVQSAGADDSGFTLVELLVVMIILGGCLLGLLAVQTSALRTVTLAKERQQATAFANRSMEQMRALPYDVVTAGLNSSDLSGDSHITTGRLRPTGYPNSIDEPIVAGGSAAAAPLFPHCQEGAATLVSGTQYRVCSYVTLVSTTAGDTTQGYWLTVIVRWQSGASKRQPITMSTRSQVFSPAGCLGTATRPFSGPCQAFHDGTAGSQPAGISVTGGLAGERLLADNPMVSGTVDLPQVTASVQSQQVVSVQAVAQTSGATRSGASSDPSTGLRTASTGAFTDPDASASAARTTDTVSQTANSLTSSGSASAITLQPGLDDTGASASTTNATTAAACQDLSGTAIVTGQACASSRLTPPTGPQSVLVTYGQSIPLASVAAPTSAVPSRAFVARYLTSGGIYCPTTSGPGCISANTARALGTAVLGGLPGNAVGTPSGFGTSMVSVTGYTDRTGVAAGIGSEASTAGRTGSLSYWNGSSYTPVVLGPASTGTFNLGTVTATYLTPSNQLIGVVMTGSVSLTPSGSEASGPPLCQPAPCARSSSSGTVTASVTYELSAGTTTVGRFTTTLNLGSSAARATYRAPLGS